MIIFGGAYDLQKNAAPRLTVRFDISVWRGRKKKRQSYRMRKRERMVKNIVRNEVF